MTTKTQETNSATVVAEFKTKEKPKLKFKRQEVLFDATLSGKVISIFEDEDVYVYILKMSNGTIRMYSETAKAKNDPSILDYVKLISLEQRKVEMLEAIKAKLSDEEKLLLGL